MRNYNGKSHKKFILQAHIIFSTKYRKPILTHQIGTDVKQKIIDIAQTSRFEVVTQEVDNNHIHVLVSYEPNISISQIIRKIKSETTYYVWARHAEILKHEYYKKHKLWADGYFVCSVGDASENVIRAYIDNQG